MHEQIDGRLQLYKLEKEHKKRSSRSYVVPVVQLYDHPD